jgi:hypothetical protein
MFLFKRSDKLWIQTANFTKDTRMAELFLHFPIYLESKELNLAQGQL